MSDCAEYHAPERAHFRLERAIRAAIRRAERRLDDCAAATAGLDQQARLLARRLFDAHNAICDDPRCLGF